MSEQYIDLITGRPLEPWAREAMERRSEGAASCSIGSCRRHGKCMYVPCRHSPRAAVGERPDDEALDPHLPDTVKSERRCGIQRSDWMTGWFVPWSPRNDNQNAEGPWSHWVALAHAIIAADEKAILALQSPPAKVEVECPSSPDGRHQVDTTMESGPDNCFHCEAPMGGAA